MKLAEIKEVLHAQPFEPFVIHVADGKTFRIEHQEFAALHPGGRQLVIFTKDGSFILNTTLITTIQVPAHGA
ncbi:MAG: hypothetical protein JWM99_4203 [Verrucomicrobiales bacterium]|nr:hypothetical protein [Verrucomicrobiales bacterium]